MKDCGSNFPKISAYKVQHTKNDKLNNIGDGVTRKIFSAKINVEFLRKSLLGFYSAMFER